MNNLSKKHLFVDCDGVLLDPVLGFIRWIFLSFPRIDVVAMLKMSDSFLDQFIKEFYSSDGFSKIPMVPHVKDFLNILKPYYKIDVVTSCGNDKKLKNARIDNLEKIFGKNFFNEVYFLPYKGSKIETYSLDKKAVVVDDELQNCIDAMMCGHTVFKLKYNQLIKKIIGYDIQNTKNANLIKSYSWKEITEQLLCVAK